MLKFVSKSASTLKVTTNFQRYKQQERFIDAQNTKQLHLQS